MSCDSGKTVSTAYQAEGDLSWIIKLNELSNWIIKTRKFQVENLRTKDYSVVWLREPLDERASKWSKVLIQ